MNSMYILLTFAGYLVTILVSININRDQKSQNNGDTVMGWSYDAQ